MSEVRCFFPYQLTPLTVGPVITSPSLETAILGEPSCKVTPTKRATKPFFNQRSPLPRRTGPSGRASLTLDGTAGLLSFLEATASRKSSVLGLSHTSPSLISFRQTEEAGLLLSFKIFHLGQHYDPHPGPHSYTTLVLGPTSDFSFRLCVQAGLLLHQLVPVPGRQWELLPRQHPPFPVYPHHLQLCQHQQQPDWHMGVE